MLDSTNKVAILFEDVDDIPSLPVSVCRVLDMVDRQETCANDIARVLMTDPAISAKILRLANSSYYGFRQQIGSIRQAIALLGFSTLKNTLLSVSLIELFRPGSKALDVEGLWVHSFAAATASKLVSTRIRYSEPEKAFAAGLMHDLGKLIIARNLPAKNREIAQIVHETGICVADAERAVLGVDHADVGAWLLNRWNLPPEITEAVGLHHHPRRSLDRFDICAVVYLANIVAHRADIGYSGDCIPREIDPAVSSALGITEQDICDFTEALDAQRGAIEEVASDSVAVVRA